MTDSDVSPVAPIDIPFERSLYVGIIFRGILYGVEIFTFFLTMYCISQRPHKYRKHQKFYIVYGAILLTLATLQVAIDVLWGEFMWIDHHNCPGEPLGYYLVSQATWYVDIGLATTATANMLSDGLLLYRCFIIWDSRWCITALPALTYLASFVIEVVTVVECALPGTSLLHGKPVKLALWWFGLSAGLNVIITSMICFRIIRMRAVTRNVLSPEMSSMYTSAAAILIESVVPFSILGIGLVITLAQDVPPAFAFSYVWSMLCTLSPQMIILRVAMGRGWIKETSHELSTALEFAQPPTVQEQSKEACAIICDTEDLIHGPGTPANNSDVLTRSHTIPTGGVSHV